MMKSLMIGAALALMGAGAAQAEAWEAVAASDQAVMAVDWQSMSVNGNVRRVTIGLVAVHGGGDVPFDYAASTIDVDCPGNRYATVHTDFFRMNGTLASEAFEGDGSWDAINEGGLMADVRREVCASNASRPGYFNSLGAFAVNVRAIAAGQ